MMLATTEADNAMETARQIAKTHDDCMCEGADMATLVSRIKAHVLAYAAERERLLAEADEAIAYWGDERATDDHFRWSNEAASRHRARSSSPAQDDGKPTT